MKLHLITGNLFTWLHFHFSVDLNLRKGHKLWLTRKTEPFYHRTRKGFLADVSTRSDFTLWLTIKQFITYDLFVSVKPPSILYNAFLKLPSLDLKTDLRSVNVVHGG